MTLAYKCFSVNFKTSLRTTFYTTPPVAVSTKFTINKLKKFRCNESSFLINAVFQAAHNF